MCRFLESIQLNNGEFKRLPYHQARMDFVMKTYFPNQTGIQLIEMLSKAIFPKNGKYKCRILFDAEIQSVEFTAYTMREIQSLKIVETDLESASFKSANREKLNEAFALRGECDDVILVKDGLLTDTSYTNIALFDGKTWVTPQKPLIYGVNRAELLENGLIVEKEICIKEVKNFEKIRLFNAMIEFGEIELEIKNIAY